MREDCRYNIGAHAGDLLARWARLWDAPYLADGLTIEVSPRLRASIGRCYPERRLIRLASWVVEEERTLLPEVLCHEAAHVVVYERNGRRGRPHGPQWQSLMKRAGFEPRVRLAVPQHIAARLERRRRRYRHECPVCRVSCTAGRPMRRWRCAACLAAGRDGRLVITSLAAFGETGSGSDKTQAKRKHMAGRR